MFVIFYGGTEDDFNKTGFWEKVCYNCGFWADYFVMRLIFAFMSSILLLEK